MKTQTHRQNRATALATVAFATLVFTTAPAATRESWPQRIEAEWLLAEEVAAQDQLGGLVFGKADAIGETPTKPLLDETARNSSGYECLTRQGLRPARQLEDLPNISEPGLPCRSEALPR